MESDTPKTTDLIRNEILEEAARVIDQNAEITLHTTIAGTQYVVPRKEGDVVGLSYARAIRALKVCNV